MLLATSLVFQIASGAVLISAIGLLVLVFRDRGKSDRRPGRLERAQTIAIAIAAVGLGVDGLFDSEIASAFWVAGIFTALGITIVRWRKNEPLLPSWL